MKRAALFLGNIGAEYQRTRHNMGFIVGDCWMQRHGNPRLRPGCSSLLAEHQELALVVGFPQTLMNLSGRAAKEVMRKYQLQEASSLLLVVDCLHLELGAMRFSRGGSHAGQNGVRSVIDSLGGEKGFARLRLGIGSPAGRRGNAVTHVMGNFSSAQWKQVERVAPVAAEAVDVIRAEWTRLQTEGVTAEELENAKTYLTGA